MEVQKEVLDRGPFFHGTKAELQIGDLLEPNQMRSMIEKLREEGKAVIED